MAPKVKMVKYLEDYKLTLVFQNNERRQFDLTRFLQYPVYQPLKDEAFCRKVIVKNGIVQWSDEIDLDPDIVYVESTPL